VALVGAANGQAQGGQDMLGAQGAKARPERDVDRMAP